MINHILNGYFIFLKRIHWGRLASKNCRVTWISAYFLDCLFDDFSVPFYLCTTVDRLPLIVTTPHSCFFFLQNICFANKLRSNEDSFLKLWHTNRGINYLPKCWKVLFSKPRLIEIFFSSSECWNSSRWIEVRKSYFLTLWASKFFTTTFYSLFNAQWIIADFSTLTHSRISMILH